jgi:outer membrane lipopolysaccharide assembly protein LptE/RlpB
MPPKRWNVARLRCFKRRREGTPYTIDPTARVEEQSLMFAVRHESPNSSGVHFQHSA